MLRAIPILLFSILAACVEVVPTPPLPSGETIVLASGPGSVDSFGKRLNAERAAAGVGNVVRNAQLEAAALAHARDMESNDFFDHKGSDRSSPGDRARTYGYKWCSIAENIAKDVPSEQALHEIWMKSSGHRKNNLNRAYNEYGIARAGNYWVLKLGKRC